MIKYILLLSISISSLFSQSINLEMDVAVTKTDPLYETVIEKIPVEHCWDEKIPITNKNHPNLLGALIGGGVGRNVGKGKGKEAATVAGTIIGSGANGRDEIFGGILGGLVGRKIGKGKGKEAATVLGTLLGTELSTKKEDTGKYRIEKRCETVYKEEKREVLVGYTLRGTFMGKPIAKFSNVKQSTIRVSINASY